MKTSNESKKFMLEILGKFLLILAIRIRLSKLKDVGQTEDLLKSKSSKSDCCDDMKYVNVKVKPKNGDKYRANDFVLYIKEENDKYYIFEINDGLSPLNL
jgi:hypothetical protein